MNKFFLGIITSVSLVFSSPAFAAITQVDSLIEKLVEKDVITDEEARELREDIVKDEKLHRDDAFLQGIPEWVQKMKIKGDLRVRYQGESRKSTNARHRGRVRMRLGVETQANDKLKVAVGIATGSGDPRSTNETMENSFEKMDLRLDYAYAEYTPSAWFKASVGKMPKPFWNPKDLIFDTDITFDGFGMNFTHKVNDQITGFFNTGFFVLDENSTENYDPFMWGVQPGVEVAFNDNIKWKTAFGYFDVSTIQGYSRLVYSSNTNTVIGTNYAYDYDNFTFGTELSMDNLFDQTYVPNLTLFAEGVHNPDADEHNTGFLLGGTLGEKKIAGAGQWQLGYNYRRLERNAVLDIFPDSDFYGGGTHVQGHEALFSVGLAKNVSLDFDYYRSNVIGGEDIAARKDRVEHIFQSDLNFKF